jgi:hypothetical protein
MRRLASPAGCSTTMVQGSALGRRVTRSDENARASVRRDGLDRGDVIRDGGRNDADALDGTNRGERDAATEAANDVAPASDGQLASVGDGRADVQDASTATDAEAATDAPVTELGAGNVGGLTLTGALRRLDLSDRPDAHCPRRQADRSDRRREGGELLLGRGGDGHSRHELASRGGHRCRDLHRTGHVVLDDEI